MKSLSRLRALVLCLATLAGAAVFAQPAEKSAATSSAARSLTKFNLDFPGGTPGELTAAIQKAMGRPLNVVVPTEHAARKLPPLKMTGIDTVQLFAALELVGPTMEVVASGNGSYTQAQTRMGFKTSNLPNATDDSIWTFYVTEPGRLPKISRFYLLTPYLEAGLSVDDITTAIQTSWKMRGDKETPTLSFHKETKLLIAVGDYSGLDTIEYVLKTLDGARGKSPSAAKAGDAQKTKP